MLFSLWNEGIIFKDKEHSEPLSTALHELHKLPSIEDRPISITHTSPLPEYKDMFYPLDKELKTRKISI